MIKLVSDVPRRCLFMFGFEFSASVFLLSSIRVPEHMQELISYQFQHPDASFRIGATLRFTFTCFIESFLFLTCKHLTLIDFDSFEDFQFSGISVFKFGIAWRRARITTSK